jgi:uncharacterized membrane protein
MSVIGVVRAIHIVSAVFWAGAMFFIALFLEPSVRALGPEGGRVMQMLEARNFFKVMIANAVITLITGFYVFWQLTGGFAPEWRTSAYAHTLLTGATLALITFGIGVFVTRPTFQRMGAKARAIAASGAPPTPADLAELDRLRTRLRIAGRTVATLLLLTVLAMASARYV